MSKILMRCATICLLNFVIILLPACSNIPWFNSNKSINEPAELESIVSQVEVQRLWSNKVGNLGNKYETNLKPTVVDDTVFIANKEGEVSAIDINNGRVIWEVEIDYELSAGPAVQGDKLALGTLNGEALILSADSGALIWSAEVTSEILSTPAIVNNRLITRSNDGRVYGFDLESGNRIWVYDREMPILTIRGNSPPIIRAGIAVFGFDNGYMTALRAEDGAVLWEEAIARPAGKSELERLIDIDGQMGIIATDIYSVGFNGRLVAITLASGKVQWTRDFSSVTGLAISRTNLFISDIDSHIWAVDRRNGSPLWQQDKLEYRELSTPAVINDYVVVGDLEGYVHFFNKETGDIIGRHRAHKTAIITAPIVVDNEVLISFDIDGNLSALKVKSK